MTRQHFRALNQIAPATKRQRTDFIRKAVKDALRKREYASMREAYRKQPDSAAEADEWSTAAEFSRRAGGRFFSSAG